MYSCSNCGMPLTKFDVAFSKKLYVSHSNKKCECFKCISQNGKAAETIRQHVRDEESLKPHIVATVFTLLSVIILLFVNNLGDRSFGLVADILIGGLGAVILVLGGLLGNLICGIIVVVGFGISIEYTLEGTGNYHYKSTLQNDGSIRTEKIEEVTGSTGCSAFLTNIFLVLTFVIWCIPHLLYMLPKKKKRYEENKELIDAYNSARSQYSEIVISPVLYNDYESLKKQYEQERKK